MIIINRRKWNRKETILFLERLEMYISAGLPINKVLPLLASSRDKNKNTIISNMAIEFEKGNPLSSCLSRYLGISKIISHMIEYGELSGKLNRSINLSIRLITKEDELFKKCLNALLYPVFIGSFSLILTLVLVQKVLSQIIPLINSLNVDLPVITRIVIVFSGVIKNYGLYIIIATIFIFIVARYAYTRSGSIKKLYQNLLIRIPILGTIIYNYHLSLFFQSCGSLIESGLTIFEAYSKSQNAVTFAPIKTLLVKYSQRIGEGMPLSRVFADKNNPIFLQSIISAGENSGSLGTSIIRAHQILDRDLDQFLKKFTVLIEPIMMIVMGLFVGTIAVSIMIPIYSISNTLQK